MLQRMQHLKLAAAWGAWQDAVTSGSSKRQQAARAVQYFAGSRQRRAFDTWRWNVAEARAEAAAVSQHARNLQLKVTHRTLV